MSIKTITLQAKFDEADLIEFAKNKGWSEPVITTDENGEEVKQWIEALEFIDAYFTWIITNEIASIARQKIEAKFSVEKQAFIDAYDAKIKENLSITIE